MQILLSTYNGEAYIDEQVKSLLDQEDVHIQIIVRDDGSTDRTIEKLAGYEKQFPEQIIVYNEGNKGVVESFFDLIRLSSDEYDYFAFCDQDDVWNSNKLIQAITTLREREQNQPLVFCSATQMTDEYLVPLKVWPSPPAKPLTIYNALVENVCVGCTMVLNKDAMRLVKGHMPQNVKNVIMHDWWVYLCASAFGEVVFDPKPSILYRQHQSNVLGGARDGWVSKWQKRLGRFIKGKNRYILSKQATEFLDTFHEISGTRQGINIREFLDHYTSNTLRRVIYIIRTPFYRQSWLDHVIYKFVYIAGKL